MANVIMSRSLLCAEVRAGEEHGRTDDGETKSGYASHQLPPEIECYPVDGQKRVSDPMPLYTVGWGISTSELFTENQLTYSTYPLIKSGSS